MAVLELYGKCKELGYCDCEGFFGCNDPDRIGGRPSPSELDSARKAVKAEAIGEGHRKYDAGEPMLALVECEVCDRSHAPNHPHITNIEGDTPLDDYEPVERKADPIISVPPDDQLPEWLRDKPKVRMRRKTSPSRCVRSAANRGHRGMPAAAKRHRAPGGSTARSLNQHATPAARSSAATTSAKAGIWLIRPARAQSHVRTASAPESYASATVGCGPTTTPPRASVKGNGPMSG
jgi:hypothetical protein